MRFFIIFLMFISTHILVGQVNYNYGGTNSDIINKSIIDDSKNIYLCGRTSSSDYSLDTNYGGTDALLIKLDSNKQLVWAKNYGGKANDNFTNLFLYNNKLYCTGTTSSDSGDIIFNHGEQDFWLSVLDTSGNLLFDSCYGGNLDQVSNTSLLLPSKTILIAGTSLDSTGQISEHFGNNDFWFIEVDTFGNLIGEKSIGGTLSDIINAVAILPNGDFIVAGSTNSPGIVFYNYQGSIDGAVACLDSNWNPKWQKCFGEASIDIIKAIEVVGLDTIFLMGSSSSNATASHGNIDATIWQVDRAGILNKIAYFGGGGSESLSGFSKKNDSIYFLTGSTSSYYGQINSNFGGIDAFVIEIDKELNFIGANSYGGSNDDMGISVLPINDSAITFISYTNSDDYQVLNNYGDYDIWVLDTLFKDCSVGFDNTLKTDNIISVFPNPTNSILNIRSKGKPIKTLEVYQIEGKQLIYLKPNRQDFTINLSGLSNGFYIMRIITKDGEISIKKLIITH